VEAISNTDRLMAILREELRKRAQTSRPGRGAEAKTEGQVAPRSGLEALATLDGAEPGQLRRACIQALLADQLGRGLLNDAQFQQIVTRVTDTISEDPAAALLLDRVVANLKST
jgi:hypothetical protein